jgi:hypothetical protein
MTDPIEKLADQQLLLLAADVQVQLEKGTAMRPVLYMLAEARSRAAKALLLFMDVDAEKPADIRKLQSELKLYDDMIGSVRMMLQMGREAQSRISEDNRLEIQEIVDSMSPEDRRLYNLQPQGSDA